MLERTKYLIAVTAAGVLMVGAGLGYQRRMHPAPVVKPITALSVSIDRGELQAINIHNPEGDIVATIQADGSVQVLKGTPEESARAFWAALSGYIKTCSKL